MLICRYCGARNQDPGGPVERYRCGTCGLVSLYRIPETKRKPGDPLAGALVGAGIGGAIGNVPGAIIGALIGALLGRSQ